MPRVTRKHNKDLASIEIKRLWGDLPVVDATANLRVFMSLVDVKHARRKDPAGCVFARACRRLFHSTKVLFFRTVAYVDLPDEQGNRHVERFQMDREMRDLVAAFDRGEGVIPAGGFLLRKPIPSNRLDAKRESNREGKHRTRRELRGEIGGPGAFKSDPLVIDVDVRSGIGAVHFTRRKSQPAGEVVR